MSGAALIIADDNEIAEKLATVIEFIEYDVALAGDLGAVKSILDQGKNFLIALIAVGDRELENAAVAEIIQSIPSLPVYLVKEHDKTINQEPLTKGVNGILQFPVRYKNILGLIRQAEQERKLTRSPRGTATTLTGTSAAVKEIQALVRHVAMTDANVLLLGESGTGKEVVGRGIHHLSLRTDHPFVAVNCGAIPPDLLESELFGHEKGAFTGAISTRRGRFELAEGGTLFLDEIGDMPMPMQVKLLRVIQERCFERVGGTKTIQSNVRLIAATHQDLEKKIGDGKFRMDLFYRLNVFPIELPALRDRTEDIPLLIKEFATRMEIEHRSPIEFDDSAIQALSNHPLPGNVRELENLVERLAILYPGETITNDKLPKRYQLSDDKVLNSTVSIAPVTQAPVMEAPDIDDGINLKEYLSSLEKDIIEQALVNSNWVVAKAAKQLSLQRTTLVEKIRKLEIQNH